MRKYLTTGLLGTFLGLVVGGVPAEASIISRGFFDEKIADYATLDSLNSKADKSEITTLSNIIGTPAELTYWDIITNFGDAGPFYSDDYYEEADKTIPYDNLSEFLRLSYTDPDFPGVASLGKYLFNAPRGATHWPLRLTEIFYDYQEMGDGLNQAGFYRLLFSEGTSETVNGQKVYTIPHLSQQVDKIGVVPDGYNNLADALAAVKITADTAKELAERAIPNILNESSNGKYVLTAEKVGDTATYKWEIIDRTTIENTATTNE